MPLIGELCIAFNYLEFNVFGSGSDVSTTMEIFNGPPTAIMLKVAMTGFTGEGPGEAGVAVSILDVTHRNDDGSDQLISFGDTAGTTFSQVAFFDPAMVHATLGGWSFNGSTRGLATLGFWA